MTQRPPVIVNDRSYPWPKVTAIAICLDGCEPEYLTQAIAKGLMPTLQRMRETGADRLAHSVIPSFTNPNNLSIATGRALRVMVSPYLINIQAANLARSARAAAGGAAEATPISARVSAAALTTLVVNRIIHPAQCSRCGNCRRASACRDK
ncbi:alkaline phosphatase family protein [Pseudorhodobacter sp.]|uniref:alkaline phosphatase family protein n=1 Tax=Pseudorhodobacter sp. TaxID=1934400 RepID=UPI002AFFB6D0|nr:alkaline phosphatase family protein [Pseudorhodobacter sp.]